LYLSGYLFSVLGKHFTTLTELGKARKEAGVEEGESCFENAK
jgi:hypothetical protein